MPENVEKHNQIQWIPHPDTETPHIFSQI